MTNEQKEKFDFWCIVELFGHQKIAGRCTEQNIAGVNMLRVDVPETEKQPAFTRFLGASAIYAINPVSEDACVEMAKSYQVKPVQPYEINELLKKVQMALPEAEEEEYDEENPWS